MSLPQALASGAAGACFLNLVHETARKTLPNAPHVDIIAMRALGKPLQKVGHAPSKVSTLRKMALAGDLASNSAYYAWMVASARPNDSKSLWTRAAVFGLAAGIGAVVLPPVMGLGRQPTKKPVVTSSLTVAWYTLGALAAAGVSQVLQSRSRGRAS